MEKAACANLVSRMFQWRIPAQWYLALLIPPVLVLAVLFCLETFVSPVYAPNRFLLGILFGIPAGFLEEIGWMGYAFPKMRTADNALAPSILLGLAVVALAFTGHRFPGDRHTARPPLVRLSPRIHVGHDGHASFDLLDLHQHKQRLDCPAYPRQFHGLPGHLQRPARDRRARSDVVWNLRSFDLAGCRDHRQGIRPAIDTAANGHELSANSSQTPFA